MAPRRITSQAVTRETLVSGNTGFRSILGVDVGERYLDLAALDLRRRRLRFGRVDLATPSDRRRIETIAGALAEFGVGPMTLALVDSPQAPRQSAERPREIDRELYRVVRELNAESGRATRLSMFPTPTASYFVACASDVHCPAHLRSIAREIFGRGRAHGATPPVGGQIFTRFMLSGFAAHRAFGLLGADVFESYPFLAFELWRDEDREMLPPKGRARDALASRVAILIRLARELQLGEFQKPEKLDQADAAALATTAAVALAGGRLIRVEAPREGRFALALPRTSVVSECRPLAQNT